MEIIKLTVGSRTLPAFKMLFFLGSGDIDSIFEGYIEVVDCGTKELNNYD
jgi:hypothetical protein